MLLRTASIAERDITESALWLDAQQPGLGDDFLAAVQAAFADISRMPAACPTLDLPGLSI